jgi:murein DD-endopeptidase MepM/ murein hydrolase activator NlpD
MHIILVSDHMATARSIRLTVRHLMMAITGLMAVVLALSSLFSYLTVRHAAEIRLPFLQEMLRSISLEEAGKTHDLVRENLANMATRLGQMQGQLMQLDTLGERLAGLAGVNRAKDDKAVPAKTAPAGSGGPLVRPDSLTTQEMQRALDELSRQVEARIRNQLLPSSSPLEDNNRASGFGWRVDPITGQSAMHEGVDFLADPGTPIIAAAAGVVLNVERHPHYGNLVEIDHGEDLVTRYAHASAVFVKPGELVRRGQKVAAVGSTGRSTGPHLHFEVRFRGAAQNPAKFLVTSTTVARSK